MKHFWSLFVLLGISTLTTAQLADSLYLNVVIPEQDTVVYSYSRYRVAANTLPGAKAFINNKEVQVYGSGAFVDMVFPEDETTPIEFKVELNGQQITRTLYLVKPTAVPIEFKGKKISDKMVLPNGNVWLNTGELLTVQFLGTPGEEVVFNIDGFKRNIPMKELPIEMTNGMLGVYRGSYEVKPGDLVSERHITFKMKKGLFGYAKKTSDFVVSLGGFPRVGMVIDEGAYLNSGLGTDRLGGYKYGAIEQGVKLNITGLKNGSYRVKLSDELDAWIPSKFVELLPEQTQPVESLTGNIRITGSETEDVITLSLSQKLPYTTYQEISPNKIVVDVFGATSNTNWKTKMLSSNGIKNVEWQQVANGQFRLIIELAHTQNWGYSVGYGWGSQMVIKVKRPPVIADPINPLNGKTITVDAGHGGTNNGSLGATGMMEKVVTLQISQKLDSLLQLEGAHVVMPRTDDTYMYMSDRRDLAIEQNTDLLVSIHCNSIGYGSDPRQISGTGGFYKHMAYKPLTQKLYQHMLELGLADYGLTGSFNFSLSAPIEFPNALVETAFLSNPEEEMLLIDPAFQTKIAQQIVQGLKEYFLENGTIESLSDMPIK